MPRDRYRAALGETLAFAFARRFSRNSPSVSVSALPNRWVRICRQRLFAECRESPSLRRFRGPDSFTNQAWTWHRSWRTFTQKTATKRLSDGRSI